MDASATSTADVSAIWAALQAAEDGHARPAEAAAKSYAVAGFTDDAADEEEEDDEDDDVEDDEMAPVMPQRLGSGGLLPSSLYSATGSGGGLLADVVPAFLLPSHRSPYAPAALVSATATTATATSSSEMFLDDILHAHDDTFAGGGREAPRLTAERLSQLEDNYERKKKRAKINRRDLNSRFQELMDLLHLKEDRKLNRAKVLEKAIEQITKLTEELRTTRQQLQRYSTSNSATTSSNGGMQAPPFHAQAPGALPLQMPLPMPQWSSGAAPLMWMPLLPSVRPSARPTSARARSSGPKAAKTTTPMTTSVSIQTQTSPEKRKPRSAATMVPRPGRKRGRETGDLVGVALEVPTLLEFCDAWTLRAIMGVSQELHTASRREPLWQRLCHHRWRRHGTLSFERNQRMLWKQLDAANEMPHVGDGSVPTLAFASGRRESVGLWASLVRRSNGRTTRTVLVEGRPVVRQVVELHLLVQNLDVSRPLQLPNDLRVVVVGSGCEANAFEILTGDHLAPHLVAVNGIAPNNANVGKVGNFQLFHGDVGVVSVFVACDGLDLEHQFLDRIDAVEMQCLWRTRDRTEPTWVAAHTQKPAGLAEVSVHKV